jgi:NitT/TauT family transport system ATP-binding protein/nitrate/nitrite transport system substrate-binding protein
MSAVDPKGRIRIGLLRLTDSAPLIAAQEFGFFADEGVEATLSVEPSWANVADKLAHGALDAASFLPPLAFAVTLGLRGAAQPLVIPFMMSLGGDTITLERGLGAALREEAREIGTAAALAGRLKRGIGAPLAVVHEYSTHSLLLRYWLACAGAIDGRDYELVVTPPARMVEALQSGRICGFCAGAPWGEIAERAGVGFTVATSHDIWRNAPEKALVLRERFVDENPEAAAGVLRALYRAARFCDAPQNAPYVAALLARRGWLGLDSHAILSSLPGGGAAARSVSRFHAHAANYPWRSHALWFLSEMKRWGLIDQKAPAEDLARRVYRPDLYEAALAPVGVAIPLADRKIEGGHAGPWSLPARPAPIAMEADIFCDGAVFGG